MSIAPIQLPSIQSLETAQPKAPASGVELGGAFGDALTEARKLDAAASDSAERFAAGDQSVGIHEVMIATEKASIAVRYATTMKNKAVEAYRELMNTQV